MDARALYFKMALRAGSVIFSAKVQSQIKYSDFLQYLKRNHL